MNLVFLFELLCCHLHLTLFSKVIVACLGYRIIDHYLCVVLNHIDLMLCQSMWLLVAGEVPSTVLQGGLCWRISWSKKLCGLQPFVYGSFFLWPCSISFMYACLCICSKFRFILYWFCTSLYYRLEQQYRMKIWTMSEKFRNSFCFFSVH